MNTHRMGALGSPDETHKVKTRQTKLAILVNNLLQLWLQADLIIIPSIFTIPVYIPGLWGSCCRR